MSTEMSEMEQPGAALRYRLTLVVLVTVLLAAPLGMVFLLGLDGRTPVIIAQEALHDEYGLVLVDKDTGKPLPADSSLPTASEFSVQKGAVTEDVPFVQDGQPVRCTIRVPDGPESATATCAPDDGPA
ncbi:MAG: hypothetical protein ABWX60_04630 [Aeromicrobium sp.]